MKKKKTTHRFTYQFHFYGFIIDKNELLWMKLKRALLSPANALPQVCEDRELVQLVPQAGVFSA